MDTIRYYMNQMTHAHTTQVSWKLTEDMHSSYKDVATHDEPWAGNETFL